MPGGDRTGPYGDGPMSGRRLGYCTGNDSQGFEILPGNFGGGYGRGFGRGRGRGYRFGTGYGRFSNETAPNVSKETLLENEARILKEQLASIEKQLSELKKRTD